MAWWPDHAVREHSNLLALQKGLGLESYEALHRFSVEQREAFWARVLKRLGIVFDKPPSRILDVSEGVKQPRWLVGAQLNITRSCFAGLPDKTAILFGREDGTLDRLSYERLETDVDRFAGGLRARGFHPGDGVAVYMPMTPECVIAYLGTIRAGCRVVSIADSFSAQELHSRMEIAGARAVVTLSAYRRGSREIELYPKVREAVAKFESPPVAIVVEPRQLEAEDIAWEELVEGGDASVAPFVADPYHVTNVLFSSGTTGTPKAIPWTQLTPLKAAMDAHLHQDVHPEDVVCWPTNIGWMMGPWLVYASFLNQATMALYEGVPTGAGFARFIREAGVTVLGVVPSIVRSWRASDSVEAGSWPAIRLFSSTGETSGAEDYLWLMSRTDYRAPVIEYLGGTEIGGGHLTGTVLQPASPATFSTAALGVDVVILNDDGAPVPEGEMGEAFLVPPALGLSQELLNRDHDRVYHDGCPSGPEGQVLRRHGDHIARVGKGYFKAQGRADDTMNLGGIKVSSIELERVVNDHASVYESAAVAVQPGGEGAEKLVVFVVLEKDASEAGLKAALGKSIAMRLNPLFKVHQVVTVDSLPRTASNKIMRRRLRADHAERS
jgi:acetyl-CoA synthetase